MSVIFLTFSGIFLCVFFWRRFCCCCFPKMRSCRVNNVLCAIVDERLQADCGAQTYTHARARPRTHTHTHIHVRQCAKGARLGTYLKLLGSNPGRAMSEWYFIFRLIAFGGRSARLAYILHKSGRKSATFTTFLPACVRMYLANT